MEAFGAVIGMPIQMVLFRIRFGKGTIKIFLPLLIEYLREKDKEGGEFTSSSHDDSDDLAENDSVATK